MADILHVSETEFGKDADHDLDLAHIRTVVVTRDGRDRTGVMSAEAYRRLTHGDRQVYAAGELPNGIVEAIHRTEVDPRHRHLDGLIKDWTP